ncbi:hypothetical protein J1D01_10670 [Seonamhaeicola sp. NFXS20]|uniref:hypothetical protein n=1 Tax=Seonamhaeicola sp. NFXS20 TaxID=2816959 RepID=UPI003B8D9CD9
MKKEGREIEQFGQLLSKTLDRKTKVQTHWATVTEVDWESKTMTVKGMVDDLEFYDVLLGLSSFYRKPKVGAKCLIGVILNQEASTFLIDCEAFEEAVWTTEDAELKIKDQGFSVKVGNESLKEILNDYIDEVNKIKVIYGNTINVAATTAIKQRLNTVLIE